MGKRFSKLKILLVLFSLIFFPFNMFLPGQIQDTAFAAQALTSFEYKKDLVFNTSATGADVSTNQTDFPVCVHLNSSSWSNATERDNFFGAWNGGGKRVQFFDADGTTNLCYEVEYYDAVSQEAVYWVKVPQVDGDSTTDKIVVAYGNDPNGVDQDNKAGVWDSNFKGVWHLDPTLIDSTVNGNNAADFGSSDIAGTVGRGRSFGGVDNYLELGTGSTLKITGNQTVTALINNAEGGDGGHTIVSVGDTAPPGEGYAILFGIDMSTNKMCNAYDRGGSSPGLSTGTVTTESWAQVGYVGLPASDSLTYYINGGSAGTVTGFTDNPVDNGTAQNLIGSRADDPITSRISDMKGILDEIRISDTNRSVDWIKLEYYSMLKTNFNGDAWLTWGSQVNQFKTLTDYQYKKDLVFNTSATGADVSTNQTDFPVCVHLNSSSWSNATERDNFFGAWNGGGKRVQFFDADGTTNLCYEVEYYDAVSQEAVYWVKVPQVDGDSTTDKIVVAYGNDPNGVDQDNKAGVWGNGFKAVYHLGDNSWTSGDTAARDSTSNSNNSETESGTTEVVGMVADARQFDGADNYIQMADSPSLSTGGVSFGGSALFLTHAVYTRQILLAKGTGESHQQEYMMELSTDEVSGKIRFFSDTTNVGIVEYAAALSSDTWYQVFWWYDQPNDLLWIQVDLNAPVSVSASGGPSDTTYKMAIGRHGEYPGVYWNGDIDEVRFHKDVVRSADWIKLEYYSMLKTNFNGDAWLTWGSQVNQFVPAAPTAGIPSAIAATSISWNFMNHASNEEGFKVHDSLHNIKVQQATPGLTYLDETDLSANTQYIRHIHAYNAYGDSDPTADMTRYTLALSPNISCDRNAVTWYNSGNFTFASLNAFGEGGIAHYRYVWNHNTFHLFNDTETQWLSGAKVIIPSSDGFWYFHTKSYNGEGVSGGTQTYGPYCYDATPPTNPTNLIATPASVSQIDLSWTDSTDTTSGLYRYIIYSSTDGITFNQIGFTAATSYSDYGLSSGTVNYYKVKAQDNASNTSDFSNTASASTQSIPLPSEQPQPFGQTQPQVLTPKTVIGKQIKPLESDPITLNIPLEPTKIPFWNRERIVILLLAFLLTFSIVGYIYLIKRKSS